MWSELSMVALVGLIIIAIIYKNSVVGFARFMTFSVYL